MWTTWMKLEGCKTITKRITIKKYIKLLYKKNLIAMHAIIFASKENLIRRKKKSKNDNQSEKK